MNQFLAFERLVEKLVFCVASSRPQAEALMHRLEADKFPVENISVVFPNQGALNLPGIGAYIAAGPILMSLRGASRDDTAGIAAGLMALGVAESQARRCQSALEDGNFLLSLHASTDEEIARAEEIFASLRARDICHSGVHASADLPARNRAAPLGWPMSVAG